MTHLLYPFNFSKFQYRNVTSSRPAQPASALPTANPHLVQLHFTSHLTKLTPSCTTHPRPEKKKDIIPMDPKQNDDILALCWRHQTCNSCINSKHRCGWCPYSSTCIPASNLLSPVANAHICPLRNERFELRTKALGCGCSATTLLSIIVTVFATLAAAALLWGVGLLVLRFNRNFGTGTWRGVEVEFKDDGARVEKEWKRDSWTGKLAEFFRSRRVGMSLTKSEQELVTERTRLLG